MLSFKCSLENTNVVFRGLKSKVRPNPNIFLFIVATVGDAATVNPNVIKTLLANNLSAISVFGYGFRSLPMKPPDCAI